MPAFDEFIRRNERYAAASDGTARTAMPSNLVFVVTCLDPRTEPADFLGIGTGDAIVLRNPGGRVTDATAADIALIGFMGEVMGVEGDPLEVAIVHHTECGMGFLADDGFRHGYADRIGADERDLAALAVTDPYQTVVDDVAALLASPWLTSRVVVSGHVLDLRSGRVSTVAPASPAGAGRVEKRSA